jgi:hypothetical protein
MRRHERASGLRLVGEAWNGGVVGAGNGRLAGDSISCQHGEKECEGNTILACMQVLFRSLVSRPTLGGEAGVGKEYGGFHGFGAIASARRGIWRACLLQHGKWHLRALVIASSFACHQYTHVFECRVCSCALTCVRLFAVRVLVLQQELYPITSDSTGFVPAFVCMEGENGVPKDDFVKCAAQHKIDQAKVKHSSHKWRTLNLAATSYICS